MACLVTGATGYLGQSVLGELLSTDRELVVLARASKAAGALPAGVRVVTGDVADMDDGGTAVFEAATMAVDFGGFMAPGDAFRVMEARDFFGTPVMTGVYTGVEMDIPVYSNEISTYVVLTPAADTPASATIRDGPLMIAR